MYCNLTVYRGATAFILIFQANRQGVQKIPLRLGSHFYVWLWVQELQPPAVKTHCSTKMRGAVIHSESHVKSQYMCGNRREITWSKRLCDFLVDAFLKNLHVPFFVAETQAQQPIHLNGQPCLRKCGSHKNAQVRTQR